MKRLFVALAAVLLLPFLFAPSASAAVYEPYVYLDKVRYTPGEQGTISIILYNVGTTAMEVKNVSIEFDNWMKYTADGWDELGNMTIDYSDMPPVSSNSTILLDEVSFTVPTDERAEDTYVDITICVDGVYRELSNVLRVDVIEPETLALQRAMDNMVTLLTLGALLAIIGAIIIAAAIFLTARKPAPLA
jgi:uncharacterized membrane protein